VTNVDGEKFNIVRSGWHELLRLPRRQTLRLDSAAEEVPLLDVFARVEESAWDCEDAYVKEVRLSGSWPSLTGGALVFRTRGASPSSDGAIELEANGTRVDWKALAGDRRAAGPLEVLAPRHFHSEGAAGGKIHRVRFLTARLKLPAATLRIDWVNRAVPDSTLNHLNFVASDLRRFLDGTGMDIGGLLGRDSHSWASTVPPECAPNAELRAGSGQGGTTSRGSSQSIVASLAQAP
jgi:hypothetical protein